MLFKWFSSFKFWVFLGEILKFDHSLKQNFWVIFDTCYAEDIYTISNISKASKQTLTVSVFKSWMFDKIFHFSEIQNLARVERRRLLTVSCRLLYRTKWAKTVRHAELGVAKYDTRIIISAEKEETASLVPDFLKAFADLTYRQNTEVCIT